MIKPISKKKYYETISEQIEQAILNGEWAEGSRVPTEDALASLFEVGRGSIREAITNLQMSGVLVSSPGIGTYVADNAVACINNNHLADMLNDPASIDDMILARQILETQLAAYAAENATAKDISRMQNAIDKEKDCEDVETWLEKARKFHIALGEVCKSKILVSLFESLEESTRKYKAEKLDKDSVSERIAKHQEILDAIKMKDPVLASRLMKEFLG